MIYKLVPVEQLKALEYVFPHHLENLTKMIYKGGKIQSPLTVEKKYNIVLDGSHRHVFLCSNGFKYAPVRYVDYFNPHIRVGTHLMHRHYIDGDVGISKEEVIKRGLTGDLFPPRTTRHFFPFRKTEEINIPLAKLGKREPIDMSEHIATVAIEEEIQNNKGYLKEIDDELFELGRYINEVIETKRYLQKQVSEMELEI